MIDGLVKKIKRKLGIRQMYTSETSKVRHLVIQYCTGFGCDIGFGGDKIKKENCIGIDYAKPYAFTGHDKVDIACDLMSEKIPIADNTFDYVYSSHLIEDFKDTKEALLEFIRVLKSGGNLILVFPDQQSYEKYCAKNKLPRNLHHIHAGMGLQFMHDQLKSISSISYKTLFESDRQIDYNVCLATRINK